MMFFILVMLLQACDEKKPEEQEMKQETYTYLALGDSYTIGEGVIPAERYPNQLTDLWKAEGIDFEEPKIIARTGWTTDELASGIENAQIEGQTFDWVTLLIGVNNQYRGRDLNNYREEFEQLLQKAISFARGNKGRVRVLSIPDWGVTPFAEGRNTDNQKVAREIDSFNQAKKEICVSKGVVFIDITERYREIGGEEEMLVADRLHPSGLVYKEWAKLLFDSVGEWK